MRRIPLLDGWRAVAIALVLVHHVVQGFYSSQDTYAADITRYGAFGVDIFFGLSGLLITRLLLEEWKSAGGFHLQQFYVRRAFRILPPVFVFLAVYTTAGLSKSTTEVVSSLLFFRNYVPSRLTGFGTGHLWSLAVEEHFYLIWPGLLALLGPRRSRHTAAWLALGFGVWRMIESQLATPLFPEVPAHFRTDLRLDALLWGCLVAFLLDGAKEREHFARQTRLPYWLGAVALAILCVRYYSPATSIGVALLIPVILAGTLVHPHWWISQALSWGPLAWLGRISYRFVPGLSWISQACGVPGLTTSRCMDQPFSDCRSYTSPTPNCPPDSGCQSALSPTASRRCGVHWPPPAFCGSGSSQVGGYEV